MKCMALSMFAIATSHFLIISSYYLLLLATLITYINILEANMFKLISQITKL
uniref:Uncharacterized protein n=1 Tax=Octopus bimaculoides TaxID=37653 RepID=A0A0L8HPV0_OCTBM